MKFGILGAGVVGLTTALELQSQFPSADVSIVAEKFNRETTSDGAAGIFRPGTSFSTHSEETTSYGKGIFLFILGFVLAINYKRECNFQVYNRRIVSVLRRNKAKFRSFNHRNNRSLWLHFLHQSSIFSGKSINRQNRSGLSCGNAGRAQNLPRKLEVRILFHDLINRMP